MQHGLCRCNKGFAAATRTVLQHGLCGCSTGYANATRAVPLQHGLCRSNRLEPERSCWLGPVRGCRLKPERGCGLEPERRCGLEPGHCGLEPVRRCELEPLRGCGLEPVRFYVLETVRRCGPDPCGAAGWGQGGASGSAPKSAGSWACVQARLLLAHRDVLFGLWPTFFGRRGRRGAVGCVWRGTVGAGAGLLAAAGAAQRAMTGAYPAGCGRLRQAAAGAARLLSGMLGRGGGVGSVWSVLLNLAEIAEIFTSWAFFWSCAAFSMSLRQRAGRYRNYSIFE